MDEVLAAKIALAEQIRGRLRLAGIDVSTTPIGPYPGDDYDVVVMLSDRNSELAPQIETLCAGIRVKVIVGEWRRS